jgi:lipopolysaccharide transport system permease protein
MYTTPIFYPLNAVPEAFTVLFYSNPITYLIMCFHDVFIFGHIAHPGAWITTMLLSLVALVGGYKVFRALENAFGDVL